MRQCIYQFGDEKHCPLINYLINSIRFIIPHILITINKFI
jgi:hypothetical protein